VAYAEPSLDQHKSRQFVPAMLREWLPSARGPRPELLLELAAQAPPANDRSVSSSPARRFLQGQKRWMLSKVRKVGFRHRPHPYLQPRSCTTSRLRPVKQRTL
jgi:hypothetical protein